MSRFFHGGMSDSDTSSEEEEELYSEEESGDEEEAEESENEGSEEEESEAEEDSDEDERNPYMNRPGQIGSDDSDDEGRRVVKSAKDKRIEEIEASIKSIENAQKINDWVSISAEFDKLNRLITVLTRSGDVRIPKVYIKAIADLEDFLTEAIKKDKASVKKMNALNGRALNGMKQKLRKNNREYEKDIAEYKADKDAYMVEEEVPVALPTPKPKAPIENIAPVVGDDEGFELVGKGGKVLQFTPEGILKTLRGILEQRGKKNTDRAEHIKTMEILLNISQTTYQKIRVLLVLIPTRFDMTSGSATFMNADQWKLAEHEINTLLNILENDKQYIVVENAEDWEDDEKAPSPAVGETFKVPGSIVSLVERLDDELTRALQQIDPHTTDYIDRLQHEQPIYTTIVRSQAYYESLQKEQNLTFPEGVNRIVYRRLEHVYFKRSQLVNASEAAMWEAIPKAIDSTITPRSAAGDATELITALAVYLYKHDESSVLRTRAMLCHIYHHAIHNRFYQARDMLLMSHLQEHISAADVNTQILYNRTLVQIGLCAFRAGLIYEALTALQEICGTGRLKELLAQGVQIQRYSQVTPEQERLERQRQLPFHMHINLELLEAAYLTCSMLLEIPALAATGSSPDLKKKVISKTFRRMLEYHERQIFTGPPENTRDHVMQAAKALAAGEWKKSSELIHAIKIWDLLPDPEATKVMLAEKIQEEGLRTYLFTYAPFYDTVSLYRLSEMFDLPMKRVTALVSKMIAHEEISAALDNVNKAITFRKGVELSRLQSLALTLSEKASALIDQNERTYEQKTQAAGGTSEFTGGRGGRGGRGGGRGGREGGRGRGEGKGRGGKNRGEPREQREKA